MILPFKQFFPWHTESKPAPTYFREKILAAYDYAWITMMYPQGRGQPAIEGESFAQKGPRLHTPKLHTIREGNRWKAGMKMHMAYGVRTKNYQQFNKGIPELEFVKSVQEIEIKWRKDNSLGFERKHVNVYVDQYLLLEASISTIQPGLMGVSHHYRHTKGQGAIAYGKLTGDVIAVNDGFKDLFDFFKWFNKDFKGQIIHFTTLKY